MQALEYGEIKDMADKAGLFKLVPCWVLAMSVLSLNLVIGMS